MALKLTARLILVAAVLGCVPQPAAAQSLQRLTVQSFVLSADTANPQLDVPFHLVVTLHVRERLSEIANLELPMLAQLELLGDERETVSDSRGTQYREVVTVVAHAYGRVTISAATLQAIDARDGKPKQWYSNDLSLTIGAPRVRIIGNVAHAVLRSLWRVFETAFWIVVVGGTLGLAVVIVLRRRSPAARAAPAAAPSPPIVQPSRRRQAEDALLVLGSEQTRAAAIRVRAAIWRSVGASEGATLGDVLRRPGSNNVPLRDVLVALERSAFTYDDDLSRAIGDACAALERYAESLP